MKLPRLVMSIKHLRKVLKQGPIKNPSSWERLGPCPDFIQVPAVMFSVNDEKYIVLNRSIYTLKETQKRWALEAKIREKGCIEG